MSDIGNFNEFDFDLFSNRMNFEQNRREKKASTPVTKPFSLADGLHQLTVKDLQKLKIKFEVRSSQSKKAGLIKDLAEQIPETFIKYLMLIEKERYYFINWALRNDGIIPLVLLPLEALEYFETSGYFFLGTFNQQKVLIIPDEIIRVCSDIDELSMKAIIKQNTVFKRLAAGIVHFYGIINYFDAEMLIRDLTDNPINKEKGYDYRIINVLSVTNDFASDFEFEMINGEMYIRDIRADDFINLLRLHRNRPDLLYCRFTAEEYLEAGERDVFERNKHTQDFLDFMQCNYEITKKEALELLDIIQTDILIGHSVMEIMDDLAKMLEFDCKEIFIDLANIIINIYDSSRSWLIKGHIFEQIYQKEK